MRGSAMMKPVVRNAEIILIIRELKLFCVLTTPPKRRKLVAAPPRIQIGNRHIGKSRLQQYVPVKLTCANNQHAHFSSKNTFVDQPFQRGFVEVILSFILLVLQCSRVHPRKRIMSPKR